MGEGEEGEVKETYREAGTLRREGRARESSLDHTGQHQRGRGNARLQTTPESPRGSEGVLGAQPDPHLTLKVTEDEHGRNGKARHAPLSHENELAMRGEERPASPGEEIGRARAEKLDDGNNG